MKRRFFIQGILLTLCLNTLSCAQNTHTRHNDENKQKLGFLQGLSPHTWGKSSVNPMRIQALRETALSVGARAGLAQRYTQLSTLLQTHEPTLCRVFNFQLIMLDNHVLPPVLLEGNKTLNLAGDDVIRIADRTYQIASQARFVTAAPTWREYLLKTYAPPENPDRSLLPKNRAERIIWRKYIDEGWQAGIQQAEIIFRENLSRLKRDFDGMLRYRTLLAQNIVSAPYVAQMDLGITGDGHDITVNDRILRITSFPALQSDSSEWRTEIIPHE
jgi:defect-in-organelle-trafficking protein DotC